MDPERGIRKKIPPREKKGLDQKVLAENGFTDESGRAGPRNEKKSLIETRHMEAI